MNTLDTQSESTVPFAKVLWRCRRGMLELDLFLIPFAKAHYSGLSASMQQQFVALLQSPDPDLFNWLMGYGKPEHDAWDPLIDHIRQQHRV